MRSVFYNRAGELRNGWWILIYLFMVVLFSLPINAAIRAGHVPHGPILDRWMSVVTLTLFALLCLRLQKKPLASLGLRPSGRWAADLGLGTAGGFALMLITALIIRGFNGFHWEYNLAAGRATMLAGFWLYLAVAFFEEISFRGYLFQRMVDGMGEWPTQALMALFFAWAHWGNPGMHGATKAWATLNIALAAVLLGLCYLRTRSLALPIGVHLGWNWTQGSLLGFGVSGTTDTPGLIQPVFHGKPEWLTGGAFGLEASLPCAFVCLMAVLALALWKGRASGVPSIATEP